jgi:hypothetical protein
MIPVAIQTLEVHPFGSMMWWVSPRRTSLGDFARRVQRSATLDGGVVVTDSGFTHGDRTVRLDIGNLTIDEQLVIQRIVELYPIVLLFLPDGAYRAAPERLVSAGGTSTVTFLLLGVAEVKP